MARQSKAAPAQLTVLSEKDKALLQQLVKELSRAGGFDALTGDFVGKAMPASFSEKVFAGLMCVLVESMRGELSLTRKPRGQRMDPKRLWDAACVHVLCEEHRVLEKTAIHAVLGRHSTDHEQRAFARAYQSIKKDPKKREDLERRASGNFVQKRLLPRVLQRLNPASRPTKKRE